MHCVGICVCVCVCVCVRERKRVSGRERMEEREGGRRRKGVAFLGCGWPILASSRLSFYWILTLLKY